MIGTPFMPPDAGPGAPGGGSGGAAAAVTSPQPPSAKRPRTGGAWAGAGDLLGPSMPGILAANGASGAPSAAGTAIRCLCGAAVERGAMVQCDAPQCGVWQHSDCAAAAAAAPGGGGGKGHYCDRCRVARADPFWEIFDANIFQSMRVPGTGRSTQVGPQLLPVSGGRPGVRARAGPAPGQEGGPRSARPAPRAVSGVPGAAPRCCGPWARGGTPGSQRRARRALSRAAGRCPSCPRASIVLLHRRAHLLHQRAAV
jgi:hypothetical protein